MLKRNVCGEVLLLMIILPTSPTRTKNDESWLGSDGKSSRYGSSMTSRIEQPLASRMDQPVASRMQSGSSLSIFVEGSVVETEMANPSGSYNMPYFDNTVQANFSHEVAETARLPCIVRQLGSKTVSWIRKTDSAILTVDDQKFIQDKRIQINKVLERSLWELQISDLVGLDGGVYECQVSSQPKSSSFSTLNITVPVLRIEGAPEILAKTGSKLTLKCVVKGSVINRNITWSVRYEDGSDVPLKTKMIKMNTGLHEINSINENDVGEYRCQSQGIKTVQVKLHISPERTAKAILTKNSSECHHRHSWKILFVVHIFWLLIVRLC